MRKVQNVARLHLPKFLQCNPSVPPTPSPRPTSPIGPKLPSSEPGDSASHMDRGRPAARRAQRTDNRTCPSPRVCREARDPGSAQGHPGRPSRTAPKFSEMEDIQKKSLASKICTSIDAPFYAMILQPD